MWPPGKRYTGWTTNNSLTSVTTESDMAKQGICREDRDSEDLLYIVASQSQIKGSL